MANTPSQQTIKSNLYLNLMNQSFILFLSALFLYSCNTQQEHKKSENATSQDTLVPLQVTFIADLPDSLQPKTIELNKIPGAKVSKAVAGKTIMLPVLQNENGETIVDSEGQPFLMGDGGKSYFHSFTTDDGLALDAISCSVMDKSGKLWFGTFGGGVSRYDGQSFTNFTTAQGLASNVVLSIAEDKNGNLWIGTDGGGVSRYDGHCFTNFTTAQGLASIVILSIIEDKTGNLWFATNGGGVSRYDGKSFTNFTTAQGLASKVVYSIVEDKTGHLWFGTYKGVCRYDGHSFTTFTTAQGLPNNWVSSIAVDKTGNLWLGTWGGGISRYDGKTFTNFTTAQGLADDKILSITEDKTGNLWFSTRGGGVSRYDGKTFTNFTTAQGLANNLVYSITEDKAGNIWFGTQGGGVSRYDGTPFTNFTTAQGLVNNLILSITEDKAGNLWFGTFGGVSRYDGKSFTNFTTEQGLANNLVFSVTEDKAGNLWFGTNEGGVTRYNGTSFTNFTSAQGLAKNSVFSITEDKTGNLWFGTSGKGVSRYDGQSFTNFTTLQGLANNSVWSITEDKNGLLWFGTDGGGVSCYDGQSFTNFTTDHGLANDVVFSITEDKTGNLWFGTQDGLCVLMLNDLTETLAGKKHHSDRNQDKGKGAVSGKLFKRFKTADGLPDNYVTQVIQMPNGKMAAGTNQGIALFNLSEDGAKLTDIEIYNTNTGYPVKDVNSGQHAMFLDSKGIIWAGTGSEKTALVRFDYTALQKNTEPPALVIQSVKVKDENICWYNLKTKGIRKNQQDSTSALLQEFFAYGKTLSEAENDTILTRFGSIQFDSITQFYPLPQNLVLPNEHNQIAFEFVAIETGRPFLVKYQHILEGYDKEWSPVSSKNYANFGNISEGTYTFKLKAQGANGVWSEPVTYSFRVLPPWYRSWWAYLSYALMFLLALRIFSKYRERQLRSEKEKLEKTVEERTAEVVAEKKEADKQRQRSDELLLNILPEEVAEELKAKGTADAKQFDEVSVLFTDFVDFTSASERLIPKELVKELDECFSAFDTIMEKHGLEKIKTIGDAYMAVCGLPSPDPAHAEKTVLAALDIVQFMAGRKKHKATFDIRLGVNSGSVVAGIVGVKKFQYDIWGDTVNTASRMESSGTMGMVNISETTYKLVKDTFHCVHRGKVQVKGKGEIDMYFVEGKIVQEPI
ncbi:MAG TPA: two-component regulator propeller domain-containing protein [Saprospiraceae bacterium]|nr:two-component regulator propeller domain-containing protein [Saprospiraceae bacterium]